jgi:hypothetical protein
VTGNIHLHGGLCGFIINGSVDEDVEFLAL